ncbi:DUF5689 domain-containing protein [Antarcticibacterium sp. 1MA-6-2]|uniref:DUF5689 domain-containing protein n=1 Tax=Antarcticibacterium sp. 1MA-6-2 TaxID=2908210 RepID=UPI001F48CE94|nr:DUF5689 domain-containing protein [Antarcticibacterium sp. 1MA-6-2]UJH90002.1 DUF5689 domain-containing protein [Antarcticibacterium sp. 1MA-6-2]
MGKIRILILIIISLSSCVKTDDFQLPEMTTPPVPAVGNITTIDAVKGHYNFNTNEIYTFRDTNTYFEGFVISSDEGGNFYKKLILQDKPENPTSGIQVLIDDNSLFDTYNFGRKVYIKLDGLSLWYNNGVMQLGKQNRGDVVAISQALIDDHIIRTNDTATIVPLDLKITQFNEQFKNLYIRIDNVQFNRNLIKENDRYTFAAENFDQYDGVRQVESCESGATTNLSTSTFSNFRSLLLPTSSGSVEGVLARDFYDDFYVVIITSPEALDFNDGARCDPQFLNCGSNSTPGIETVFEESFETITTQRMLETRGWMNINTSGGSEKFKPGTLQGNRHVRISAYNTQENPLEAWLITPPIDVNAISNRVLSFDLRASFDNATILRVLVTNEFTGNPLTTNWQLLEANIPVGPTNQNAVTFTRSHIDISCLEGTIHVAFHYLGSASEKSTTYDIDNVRVTSD